MNWFSNLNTGEIISRDRNFRVALRPTGHGDPCEFDVPVTSEAMRSMAQHGPIVPVLNAYVINEAKRLAPDEFGWFSDPIQEIATH
jgi:hypothetical protein